jgi:hypothetical protein
MAFSDKYKVQPLPKAAQAAQAAKAQLAPEDRARGKLQAAIQTQRALLAAELTGKSLTIKRNGKEMAPRAFWTSTPAGVAFTPRFGNQFLFDKGQGVLVGELAAMEQVLTDFEAAVQAKEFDGQIVGIAKSRLGTGGGEAGMGVRRGRGRPRRS